MRLCRTSCQRPLLSDPSFTQKPRILFLASRSMPRAVKRLTFLKVPLGPLNWGMIGVYENHKPIGFKRLIVKEAQIVLDKFLHILNV